MALPRCRPRFRRSTLATAVTVILVLLLGGCGGSSKKGGGLAPDGALVLVPDSDAERGLHDLVSLAGNTVALAQAADGGAKAAAKTMGDKWASIRGTIRARDLTRFLDIDDAVAAIKSGADNGLPDKADAALELLRTAVASYVPGPGGVPTTLAGTPTSVPVELRDNEITSPPIKAGPVLLKIANVGAVAHALAVVRTDLDAVDLPTDENGNFDFHAEGVKLVDERENIGPGQNATLRVDLTTGHYLFVCDTPGHFAKHMYQLVNVE